jgi:hypothetical protein
MHGDVTLVCELTFAAKLANVYFIEVHEVVAFFARLFLGAVLLKLF